VHQAEVISADYLEEIEAEMKRAISVVASLMKGRLWRLNSEIQLTLLLMLLVNKSISFQLPIAGYLS
jgi:hypothetical protein